ncbi:MAG: hypothetical protein ABIO72_03810 [Patescibacteria group bacterium]
MNSTQTLDVPRSYNFVLASLMRSPVDRFEAEDDEPITQVMCRPTLVVEAQTAPAPPPVMTLKPSIVPTPTNDPKKVMPPKFTPTKVRALIGGTTRGSIGTHAQWLLTQVENYRDCYSDCEIVDILVASVEALYEQHLLRYGRGEDAAKQYAKESINGFFTDKESINGFTDLVQKFLPSSETLSEPPPSRPCIPPPSNKTATPEPLTAEVPVMRTAHDICAYQCKILERQILRICRSKDEEDAVRERAVSKAKAQQLKVELRRQRTEFAKEAPKDKKGGKDNNKKRGK